MEELILFIEQLLDDTLNQADAIESEAVTALNRWLLRFQTDEIQYSGQFLLLS